MRRRRVLLSIGTLLSLAGCTGDGGREPSTETTTRTSTPTATEEPGAKLRSFLFTVDGLGDQWSREVQKAGQQSGMVYAERLFQHGETGRYLFAGLRAQDSASLAEQAVSSARGQFEGGEELDRPIADEAYESYPAESETGVEFETGVLFRNGRYVGLVALAGNEPTLGGAIARGEELSADLP